MTDQRSIYTNEMSVEVTVVTPNGKPEEENIEEMSGIANKCTIPRGT